MSEMKQGIENIKKIEDSAPMLAGLEDDEEEGEKETDSSDADN